MSDQTARMRREEEVEMRMNGGVDDDEELNRQIKETTMKGKRRE